MIEINKHSLFVTDIWKQRGRTDRVVLDMCNLKPRHNKFCFHFCRGLLLPCVLTSVFSVRVWYFDISRAKLCSLLLSGPGGGGWQLFFFPPFLTNNSIPCITITHMYTHLNYIDHDCCFYGFFFTQHPIATGIWPTGRSTALGTDR